uniref:Ig-like domain-containing protein n=1 Tax=Oryzias sinensis TaxID=183150 RepID=A0A8C7YJV1_9TELE
MVLSEAKKKDFIKLLSPFENVSSVNSFHLSFLDPPKVFLSGSLQSGLSVRRGCEISTVTGKPYPSISWTKDDNKPDKDRVEILSEGNNSIVSIKNVQRKDCGKYQISVCNPSGIKSAWTRVDVMGE